MSDGNEALYFARRAREETVKTRQAIRRGDHPSAVAAHGEMATRYHAKAYAPRPPQSSSTADIAHGDGKHGMPANDRLFPLLQQGE